MRLYGRILIFVRRRITVNVKQKSIQRKENILLSLKKHDYLTIKQLQKLHDLKSDRNAYRVMKQLDPYLNHFYEGQNIYYLNSKGREVVSSEKVRKKITNVDHYLMRNDLYIELGCPGTWKNEIKIISRSKKGDVTVVSDAHFTNSNRHSIVEIDNTQKMNKNRVKIDNYRRLIERNAFGGMPELIWVTSTEYRKRKLLELCDGLDVKVFLNTDFY